MQVYNLSLSKRQTSDDATCNYKRKQIHAKLYIGVNDLEGKMNKLKLITAVQYCGRESFFMHACISHDLLSINTGKKCYIANFNERLDTPLPWSSRKQNLPNQPPYLFILPVW